MSIVAADTARAALSWAIAKHKEVNHFYDGKAYEYHLWMVHDTAKMFLHLVPKEYHEAVLATCWLHDTIEDCRVTYNDIKKEFGFEIAEMVYALTNEKGRNRKERANEKYYEGVKDTLYAAFVKICDRIANVKHSFETGSSMFDKYMEEMDSLMESIDPRRAYSVMWAYLLSFNHSK